MRKLLSSTIFCLDFILIISCSRFTDTSCWRPIGNIRSYTDSIYNATEKFGEIEKGELVSVEKHFLDGSNRDSLLVCYDGEGKESNRVKYYYDGKGKIIKEVEFSYTENFDDFYGKSISETTKTTIYSYEQIDGEKVRKSMVYEKWHFEGVDTDSITRDGECPYVRRISCDTSQIVTLYKHEIPKEIKRPNKENLEIIYLNDKDMMVGRVGESEYPWLYNSIFYTYNEHGLVVERKQKELDSYAECNIETFEYEYEYDDKGNPVRIKIFIVVSKAVKKPCQMCVRHYDYF